MGPENPDLKPYQGSLYSFDWPDNFTPHKHLSPVSVSNGIAWNNDNDLMYYIDSPTRVVKVFDFDIISGKISKFSLLLPFITNTFANGNTYYYYYYYLGNPRTLFSLDKNNIEGFPDGMTIDKNDNLWVAVFRGSCVLHVNGKTGELLNRINFPVTQITSCTFGGDDLEDLYVTSSRVNINDGDLEKQPLAGSLFKVTGLGVSGQIKSNTIVYKF